MVEVCRARWLDVAEGDAVGYLDGQPDASIGGLFAWLALVRNFA